MVSINNKYEEILKMQNIYKNYEQMIGDLIFKDGQLKFNENKDLSIYNVTIMLNTEIYDQ